MPSGLRRTGRYLATLGEAENANSRAFFIASVAINATTIISAAPSPSSQSPVLVIIADGEHQFYRIRDTCPHMISIATHQVSPTTSPRPHHHQHARCHHQHNCSNNCIITTIIIINQEAVASSIILMSLLLHVLSLNSCCYHQHDVATATAMNLTYHCNNVNQYYYRCHCHFCCNLRRLLLLDSKVTTLRDQWYSGDAMPIAHESLRTCSRFIVMLSHSCVYVRCCRLVPCGVYRASPGQWEVFEPPLMDVQDHQTDARLRRLH